MDVREFLTSAQQQLQENSEASVGRVLRAIFACIMDTGVFVLT